MLTVPLRSKRRKRALAFQKFQHLIPAVPLMLAGVRAIAAGEHGFALTLAIFEILTSGLLIGTVIRDVRAMRRARGPAPAAHAHHGVDWFHVFAAAMLVVEAVERWHLTHHWARPTLLTAAVTLGLGLFHGRMSSYSERRARCVSRTSRFTSVVVRSISSARRGPTSPRYEIGDRVATIKTRDGRARTINLADLEDARPIREALAEARQRLEAGSRKLKAES